jgi:hypothetical protein
VGQTGIVVGSEDLGGEGGADRLADAGQLLVAGGGQLRRGFSLVFM